MRFNTHSRLTGAHSLLSPSKYHWVNYDEDKMVTYMTSHLAAQRGTELHDLAAKLIRLGVKLPDTGATLNQYVNDAIGFRMTAEQTLYYSENCFGTADAISFRDGLLRVHDLKTGVTPASITQLVVYAAMFCLEYNYNPNSIAIELRIYQNDDVVTHIPTPVEVILIMEKIVSFDKLIRKIREEGE